ncbi:MAG: ABC transporter ATP-binding protein, partial [Alphaproteobacteria bacterium]|nr:ABC transporter ATP-binding protein [Alphaproteobacteria bacterium]
MNLTLSRFMRAMLRPYSFSVGVMLVVAVVFAAQTSILPYILKLMVNRLIAEPEVDPFIALTGLVAMYLATSFIISTAFRFYDYFVTYVMIPSLRKKISTYCIEHLLKLSHQFYQNNFAGSLGSKVSELVMAVPDLLQIIIDRFFSHGLALLIAVFALWQVNARFALLLLIWAVILLGIALLTSRKLTCLAAEWAFKGHRVTGRIVDTLSNMLTVRLFARGKNEDACLTASIDEARSAEKAVE